MTDLNKLIFDCGKDKIKAIKILRSDMNLDLKEAKDIIDAAYEMKKRNPESDVNKLINSSNPTMPKKANSNANKKQVGYGFVEHIWNVNRTKLLRRLVPRKPLLELRKLSQNWQK